MPEFLPHFIPIYLWSQCIPKQNILRTNNFEWTKIFSVFLIALDGYILCCQLSAYQIAKKKHFNKQTKYVLGSFNPDVCNTLFKISSVLKINHTL